MPRSVEAFTDKKSRSGSRKPDQLEAQALIFSSGCSLSGDLNAADRDVCLWGTFDGRLWARSLDVRDGGFFAGMAIVEEAVIAGRVGFAELYADRIVLTANSNVLGEIYANDLVIQEGAMFEGKFRRVERPRVAAPRAKFPDRPPDFLPPLKGIEPEDPIFPSQMLGRSASIPSDLRALPRFENSDS